MNNAVTPLVSVVIPTYNHARYLVRALESVLNQTFTNWEAIVIDNHSTDNTDEVMESFSDPRISYLKIHNNGIIAASRNAGIRVAKGEWIAFLDSDDWWTQDKIMKCLVKAGVSYDVVYHGLTIIGRNRRLWERRYAYTRRLKSPVLLDLLIKGNALLTSSVMMKRKLLEEIGGMSESKSMVTIEDYNAWLKCAQITERFKYVPDKLGYYRYNELSMSRLRVNYELISRSSVEKFIHVLNKNQFQKVEARMRFLRMQNNIDNKCSNYDDLWYVLRYAQPHLKVKVLAKAILQLLK